MKKYILHKQVKLRHDEASGNYYAFCTDSGDHFTLNRTGFEILSLLTTEKTIQEIVASISSIGTVEESILFSDTLSFLDESEKNGIIALT